MEESVFVYAVGTAGSGKSAFTAAFQRWLYQHDVQAVTVNLDPGADTLPYEPDVDVRDWLMLGDVMEEYQLGPNGAQVLAADLIALRMGEIKEVLSSFRAPYILVDTPGQMELFVFREAGRVVMDQLGPGRSMVNFLVDPFIAKRASAFVSQLMLSATTNFRFQVPVVNVLSKQDLLKEEELERLTAWGADPYLLQDALAEEQADLYNQLASDLQRILDGLGVSPRVTPTSAETLAGMEDVYAVVQDVYAGGEDEQSGVEPGERRL